MQKFARLHHQLEANAAGDLLGCALLRALIAASKARTMTPSGHRHLRQEASRLEAIATRKAARSY